MEWNANRKTKKNALRSTSTRLRHALRITADSVQGLAPAVELRIAGATAHGTASFLTLIPAPCHPEHRGQFDEFEHLKTLKG